MFANFSLAYTYASMLAALLASLVSSLIPAGGNVWRIMVDDIRIARTVMLKKIAAAEIERTSASCVNVAVMVGAQLVAVFVAHLRNFYVTGGVVVMVGEGVPDCDFTIWIGIALEIR
jgi:hypothetical protein